MVERVELLRAIQGVDPGRALGGELDERLSASALPPARPAVLHERGTRPGSMELTSSPLTPPPVTLGVCAILKVELEMGREREQEAKVEARAARSALGRASDAIYQSLGCSQASRWR